MWLMTTFGFFSVVQKSGTNHLTIRARVGSDLDNLRERYLPSLSVTQVKPGTDYKYRATVSHQDLGNAMAKIVADVTYHNFKSQVEHTQGLPREKVYARVWSVLDEGLPPLDKVPSTTSVPPAAKYGGIVFAADGRILLREPSNHYDGYVWTFAKGAPKANETPQQTALREVREETGIDAEITAVLPGVFTGGTGTSAYFLMRPAARSVPTSPSRDTQKITWATETEARDLIGKTTNPNGRKRDLDILAAAFAARK